MTLRYCWSVIPGGLGRIVNTWVRRITSSWRLAPLT